MLDQQVHNASAPGCMSQSSLLYSLSRVVRLSVHRIRYKFPRCNKSYRWTNGKPVAILLISDCAALSHCSLNSITGSIVELARYTTPRYVWAQHYLTCPWVSAMTGRRGCATESSFFCGHVSITRRKENKEHANWWLLRQLTILKYRTAVFITDIPRERKEKGSAGGSCCWEWR